MACNCKSKLSSLVTPAATYPVSVGDMTSCGQVVKSGDFQVLQIKDMNIYLYQGATMVEVLSFLNSCSNSELQSTKLIIEKAYTRLEKIRNVVGTAKITLGMVKKLCQ